LLNSTDREQRYAFSKENLEKIRGQQAPLVNSGEKINYLKLPPGDGILLWKRNTVIKQSPFINGYFYRVFEASGLPAQNGFFAYLGSFPGEVQLISAGQGDGENIFSASLGQVQLYQEGILSASFRPYDNLFKGSLNIDAFFQDGEINRLVIGPNRGGGPQVRVFSPVGKLQSSFFAYNKNARGGVQVALGDLDGDGQPEIVTGPGKGEEPIIKIFSLEGRLQNSFLAYDAKFRGGVSVAIADVLGDSREEIITGAGQGGGPQVRIFSSDGRARQSFFAYDKDFHGGVQVTTSDMNGDGREEILVGIKNF
jgi:hypothetical protein